MKTWKIMLFIVACLALASFAVAGTMTWSKPLVTAADGTLGVNQRIDKQNAVDTEMRARIAAGLRFAGYTTQGN